MSEQDETDLNVYNTMIKHAEETESKNLQFYLNKRNDILNKYYNYVAAIRLVNNENTSKIETKINNSSEIDLSNKVPFVSQYSLARPDVACCRASQKIIKDSGIANAGSKAYRIITGKVNESKTDIIPTENSKFGVNYINSQLEKGNPVMVGVDHTISKGQDDNQPADHFVVIVGRGYDKIKNQGYFIFYEVGYGPQNEAKGKSDKNRLYVEEDNTIRGTNDAGKKRFTVTDIRKN